MKFDFCYNQFYFYFYKIYLENENKKKLREKECPKEKKYWFDNWVAIKMGKGIKDYLLGWIEISFINWIWFLLG